MTSAIIKYVVTAVLTVHLANHIVFAEQTTPTATPRKPSNHYINHLVKKYGSRGTISFEGFEHLMHNLGIGDLALKHSLDLHRPSGYQMPELRYDDEATTFESEARALDAATTVATTYAAENDNNLIKLINTFDNDKQEDIFRTMHDPNHRHPRHRDHSSSRKSCLSPITLIQMYSPDQFNGTQKPNPVYRSSAVPENEEHHHHHEHHDEEDSGFSVANIQISPSAFMSMCPALLVQIEQGSCNEDQPTSSSYEDTPEPAPRKDGGEISSNAWIIAIASNTIICLCGLIGICMVPLSKFKAYHDILRFMIAVAIGTLVGDALMHLIPHALMPHHHSSSSTSNRMLGMARHGDHEHEGEHEHTSESEAVWLLGCAFLTALIMYTIESILPLLSSGGGHGHSHSHSLGGHPHHTPQISNKVQSESGSCEDLDNDIETSKKNNEENVMVTDTKVRPLGSLTPGAFMVVIGDGLHNLTDGMAIGGAFGVDPVTGMATALAVLLHELPHELGDFALLLQTGVSIRRAFVFNFISSVLSFIGVIFGLLIVNANSAFVKWIYTGTAGTFLYIAFADLVPELSRAEQSIKMCIVQSLGIAFGGFIMLMIGLYEENLTGLFE